MPPLFHIALHEPEIPNNTGNIGRTCVATGCALHLIRPLGFDTSIKALRRAGLDYWPRLNPAEHDSLDAYLVVNRPPRLWAFSTKAARTVHDVELRAGDHLLFGKETRGLPDEVLARFDDRVIGLPMLAGERSLNLATAVCAAIYLGIDQLLRRGDLALDAGRLPGTTTGSPDTDRSTR
ncbi:MAG: tRNA (cytidine(34)-2'-O)-methyltransferase [Phycisphaerales bacterium]